MSSERKRQALGKGLGALIPTVEKSAGQGELVHVLLDEIFPNPGQPRRRFEEGALGELADSIKEQGVLQPLLVRRVPGGYELVAGERRLRASRLAGLDRVPVLVRGIKDDRTLELALIENIQRENLNPVEEAQAYRELQSLNAYTQEEVARRVGKDRATVANALRLLSLPEFVRAELVEGTISAGHARALLSLKEEKAIREMMGRILKRGLSVREVELAVSKAVSGKEKRPDPGPAGKVSAETRDLEKRLTRALGARTRIHEGTRGGKVEIRYATLDELNDIAKKLLRAKS
ncbi:MAG: ParB/RepB/Spo0J family partition protein [bacterium]|nr:ParB/RepB/Spo0J family partition protein [bacterium]